MIGRIAIEDTKMFCGMGAVGDGKSRNRRAGGLVMVRRVAVEGFFIGPLFSWGGVVWFDRGGGVGDGAGVSVGSGGGLVGMVVFVGAGWLVATAVSSLPPAVEISIMDSVGMDLCLCTSRQNEEEYRYNTKKFVDSYHYYDRNRLNCALTLTNFQDEGLLCKSQKAI